MLPAFPALIRRGNLLGAAGKLKEALSIMEKTFTFGLGDQQVQVQVPAQQVLHVIEGKAAPAITDVNAAVQEVLRNPIDSPPLKEVVKAGEKVAVIVSDVTRAWTKFDQFLPTLLNELNEAGVPDADIDIVVALGSHRPHTPEEDRSVCGEEVCRRVRIHQHEASDSEKLTYMGTTSRGVKAYMNKLVAAADKVILTGGIVYHLMAGFGGGRKSVMPGVSSWEAIQSNHCIALNEVVGKGISPDCVSGKLEGNPMHLDMEEHAELLKPAFLLNAVFTPEGKFARFVAGNWRSAWREGTKTVEEIFGIPIEAKADLVLASAGGYPKDINLYQGSKTIDNAFMAVKPGGVIICFLECRDITEPPEFSGWFKHKDIHEFELALRERFTIPGYVAFKLANIAKQVSLIIVTHPNNVDFMNNAGGIIPATSIEEAMAIAKEKIGRDDFTVTVMEHGANTVPVLKK